MKTMRIKQYYLNKIASGEKGLEVRVGYNSIKKVKKGTIIRFESKTSIVVKVLDVRLYDSFAQMLEVEEADRIAPGMNKRETLDVLQKIYPPHKENLGVYVWQVEPIKWS